MGPPPSTVVDGGLFVVQTDLDDPSESRRFARNQEAAVEPTSQSQYQHALTRGVPPLEKVRDDVWAFGTVMPGEHIPYSLTYVLRSDDGRFHFVDPGWDSPDNWDRLLDVLSELGATPSDVDTIVVTHLHLDHLGMASRLQEASGATITMHRAEFDARDQHAGPLPSREHVQRLVDAWQVPLLRRDEIVALSSAEQPNVVSINTRPLDDGDVLDVPGFELKALWTPGHTSGHACFVDHDRKLLLSGDHILPTMHAGIGLGGGTVTNALADYLASLDRMAELPDLEVLPGHGYRFTGLAERAVQSRQHHLRRTGEVAAVLEADPSASTWQIASRLTWTAGWENLRGFFLYSALHQSDIHRDYVLRDLCSTP